MKKEKRIPTILGVFLVISLSASLIFIQRSQIFQSKAGGTPDPVDVRITNVTDSSFVVSWVTTKEVVGAIKTIDGLNERIFSDVRQSNQSAMSTTHYVRAEGLEANKKYDFVILADGQSFYQSGISPFSVTTASAITGSPPMANLASGTVQDGAGNPAAGAIVYLSIDGIAPLSSLVTSSGNWAVSLSYAFTPDLSSLANYQEGQIVEDIFVQAGSLGTATASVYTQDDDPVPPIILGEINDFTQQQGSAEPTPTTAVGSGRGGSLLEGVDQGMVQKEFAVLNPDDGEVIGSPRPEIFGSGAAGATVKIRLESPVTYEAELEVDETGSWSWVPPQDLEPGSHTLTIDYIDPQTGEEQTFIRTFVLAANDNNDPSFSATPSGSTVTPTLTLTPTPTSGLAASLTPTASPTATPISSPTPMTRTSQPSTESGVPETGLFSLTFSIILASLIVFLLSIAQVL